MTIMKTRLVQSAAALLLACAAPWAAADITVGVVIPMTGPGSSSGAAMKNGISLWPKTLGGENVQVKILDDATDPTTGVKNLRRLVDEDHVDVVLSSSATPVAAAMGDVVEETRTVQLALSPVPPLASGKDHWVFRMPHSSTVMTTGILAHMQRHGVKTIGFLGYSDTLGEAFLADVNKQIAAHGIKLVDVERFQRSDMSVTAQALKLVSAKPDAVLIVAAGAGAAMPQLGLAERAYRGRIYQVHSAASRDYLRVGGSAVNGAFVSAGPALVPELLDAKNPSKPVGTDFVTRYEKAFGAGTRNTFSAHAYDVSLLLDKAVPIALKSGKPGTQAFRDGLRAALETMGKVVVTQGVYEFSPSDHWGFNADTPVILKVVNGDWVVDQ